MRCMENKMEKEFEEFYNKFVKVTEKDCEEGVKLILYMFYEKGYKDGRNK